MATVGIAAARSFSASRRTGRRSEWLLLVCTSAVVLAFLTTAELALRAAAPDDLVGPVAMERLHRPSEAYGWEPRPGFAARIEGRRTTINRLGARSPEPRDETGTRRILVLGDSIAFGLGVHDEETFSALIDADSRFSTLNLAVEGYGLDQTLLRFESEGPAFRPHVVVLNFCVANDFVDTALPAFLYDGFTPKPYFRVEAEGLRLYDAHLRRPLRDRAAAGLEERLEFFRWVRGRPARPQTAGPHWTEVARAATERRADVLELTLRLIERTARLAAAGGAEFILLVHPSRRSFDEGGLEAELLGSPRLREATVVDLRESYGERGLGHLDVSLDGLGHLSPRGHREVAEVLLRLLEG